MQGGALGPWSSSLGDVYGRWKTVFAGLIGSCACTIIACAALFASRGSTPLPLQGIQQVGHAAVADVLSPLCRCPQLKLVCRRGATCALWPYPLCFKRPPRNYTPPSSAQPSFVHTPSSFKSPRGSSSCLLSVPLTGTRHHGLLCEELATRPQPRPVMCTRAWRQSQTPPLQTPLQI